MYLVDSKWRYRNEKTRASRSLECGSLKEMLVSRSTSQTQEGYGSITRQQNGAGQRHLCTRTRRADLRYLEPSLTPDGHTAERRGLKLTRIQVWKKIHRTIRMLWLQRSEGFSRGWHWSDWGRSCLNLGSSWLKQSGVYYFTSQGGQWFGVWFIQWFDEIIIDSCFILSIFFPGILAYTEPDAEREEAAGKGGREPSCVFFFFFKVNENHS